MRLFLERSESGVPGAGLLKLLIVLFAFSSPLLGQELEPRAYASAPVGLHAVLGVYSRSDGSVVMDPTLPVEDVTATVNGTALGYFQSFGFFGRFANIGLSVPYAWGTMQGLVEGEFTRITRSGLGDPRLRFAFNLVGAPALNPLDFAGYKQTTNLGLSFSFAAPLGQYVPDRLINLGTNRWAFKPELGLSHSKGNWLLEAAGGVWFFGANNQFLGESKREQDPVLSLQGHVTYNLPKRMWVGFDANFFTGGGTQTDGIESNSPSLRNSRFGVTFSIPIYRRHSFKVSYDNGVITRLGGDFSRLSVGYQFVWMGL